MIAAERKFWLERISRDPKVSPGGRSLASDMQHTIAFLIPSDKQLAAMDRLISRYRSGELHDAFSRSTEKARSAPRWVHALRSLRGRATRATRP
jgi:hypothetical protein